MYKLRYSNGYLIPSVRLLQNEKLIDNTDYVIEFLKDKRTAKQNKYLHVIFELIAEFYNNGKENETGEFYTKEKAKARILYEVGFCDYYIAKEDGTKFGIIKSTSKLNKQEFSELTENIIKVMAEKDLIIFDPETYFSKLNC